MKKNKKNKKHKKYVATRGSYFMDSDNLIETHFDSYNTREKAQEECDRMARRYCMDTCFSYRKSKDGDTGKITIKHTMGTTMFYVTEIVDN